MEEHATTEQAVAMSHPLRKRLKPLCNAPELDGDGGDELLSLMVGRVYLQTIIAGSKKAAELRLFCRGIKVLIV